MKKVIFCFMLLVISATCFSQIATSQQLLTKEDYLLKSKNQKTTGWILTGGGSTLFLIGVGLLSSNILVEYPNSQKVKNRETTGLVLLSAGGAAIAGGVVCFIASKRNRRRAATLDMQQQTGWIQQNKIIRKVAYPALTFKLII